MKKGLIKIYIWIKERSKKIDGIITKFIYFDNKKSDTLIVGLSACSTNPTYNYVKTLRNIKVNKLFIKDDYSSNNRGSFYLGGKDNSVEKTITKLISIYVKKRKIKKIIFVGSSKGGYSALNLALNFNDATIIIGAPQYYLGNYLVKSNMIPQLNFILGDGYTDTQIKKLNVYLKNKIEINAFKMNRIFIHFSVNEHTYDEHIKFLIDDLKKTSFILKTDIEKYENHNDVAYYFPNFLIKSLEEIL